MKAVMKVIQDDLCACNVSMLDTLHALKEDFNFEIETVMQEKDAYIEMYGITRLPCALLFIDDEMKGKIQGFQPYEIVSIWLESMNVDVR